MPSDDLEIELTKLTAAFAKALDRYARAPEEAEFARAETLRREIVTKLNRLPGAFLLGEAGSCLWRRLARTKSTDLKSAVAIAGQLGEWLSSGKGEGSRIAFFDETFTVVLDDQPFLIQHIPLAYAILKVLHNWEPDFLKPDKLIEYLNDADLFEGRCSDKYPVLENDGAARRCICRAIKKLPPPLRRLIRGGKVGRTFAYP